MTDKDIQKYIDQLNNRNSSETIFTRSISDTVDVAKVWPEQPKITDDIINFHSYRFFFIKDEKRKYIGAVLDMHKDLHWYIIPNSRKKGYLTKSLKEAIIPYLFNEGRENQRVTIERFSIGNENYKNSKNVAFNLGFRAINEDETEFNLNESDFDWRNEKLNEKNPEIDSERFEELKKRAFYAYKTLYKISDELTMTVNDDKGLKEVADEVKRFTWRIDDLEWENNETKD